MLHPASGQSAIDALPVTAGNVALSDMNPESQAVRLQLVPGEIAQRPPRVC